MRVKFNKWQTCEINHRVIPFHLCLWTSLYVVHKSISLSFMTLSLFVINSRCFCHYSCICLCESFFFFVSMCLSAYYAVRPFLFMLMFAIMNLSLSLCFSSQLITPIFSVFRYLNLFAFVCPFGSQSLCLQSLSLFLCPCDEVYSLFLSCRSLWIHSRDLVSRCVFLSPLSLSSLSLHSLSPLSLSSLSPLSE